MASRRKSAAREGPSTFTRRVLKDTNTAPLVLLVDDAEDARDMYAEFFSSVGLRVAVAVDGDHALWKVVSLKPQVIVMDLALPVIDGWAAIREIKRHPKTKHIPVIALTGHVTPSARERAEDAGADVVLTKPCRPNELLLVVKHLLER
jgi:CheY-like chemotaxis protein